METKAATLLEEIEWIIDATDPLVQVNRLHDFLTSNDDSEIETLLTEAIAYTYWVIEELQEAADDGPVEITVGDKPFIFDMIPPPGF